MLLLWSSWRLQGRTQWLSVAADWFCWIKQSSRFSTLCSDSCQWVHAYVVSHFAYFSVVFYTCTFLQSYLRGQATLETSNSLRECFSPNYYPFFLCLPLSSLTGGQQTLPNPEKVEKVCIPSVAYFNLNKMRHMNSLASVLTSEAVAGGVLAQWMRASGHPGGGVAGAAWRDT